MIIDNQKNSVRGQPICQTSLPGNIVNPVVALGELVAHIVANGGANDDPICTY